MQFSMQFKSHLDDSNLKIIKEYTFNTGENISLAMDSLRVSYTLANIIKKAK